MNMIPSGFEVFTVVRNPFDRLASELAWRGCPDDQYQDSFVEDFFSDNPVRIKDRDNHHLSQMQFIKGCLTTCRILRFEHLENQFREMFNCQLLHENRSGEKPILTDKSKSIVREVWREDFLFFNYEL